MSPLVPEYLEIELRDSCNASCRFCPVSKIPSGNNCCLPEKVKETIRDFSQTGIVLNFSGYGEPLCDNRLPEYVAYAKKHNVLSVWVETNGLLLTEATIDALIDSRLDVVVINMNVYVEKTDELESLIERIAARKAQKESLFPLVVLQLVVVPWIDNTMDAVIERLKGRVDRIVLRSPRSFDEIGVHNNSVNFSPLNRYPCLKIMNSLCVKASGHVGVCERDLTGLMKHQERNGRDLCALLNSPEHVALWKEQMEFHFGHSFHPCADCKEWYIPNLGLSFDNTTYGNLLAHDVEHIYLSRPFLSYEEALEGEAALKKALHAIDTGLQEMRATLPVMLRAGEKGKNKKALHYVNRQILFLRERITTFELLRMHGCRLLIPLGDAFMHHHQFEKGFSLWERVLRDDPSNSFIHERLNELTQGSK